MTVPPRAVLRKAAFQRAAPQSEIRQQHLPEGGLALPANRRINPLAGAARG